jgi:hypothetical protein
LELILKEIEAAKLGKKSGPSALRAVEKISDKSCFSRKITTRQGQQRILSGHGFKQIPQ